MGAKHSITQALLSLVGRLHPAPLSTEHRQHPESTNFLPETSSIDTKRTAGEKCTAPVFRENRS
jgi:hypothetical protein